MKAKVSEQGILIPKHYLEGAEEVDIRMENGVIIVTPISKDPITQLGRRPVATIASTVVVDEHAVNCCSGFFVWASLCLLA